jgi:hypothetical protein
MIPNNATSQDWKKKLDENVHETSIINHMAFAHVCTYLIVITYC